MSKGFLALQSRYVIEGELKPEGAIHVGSGLAGPETDALVTRDALGTYIPGSSLRGAMRSRLERILQAVEGNGCVLFEEGSHKTCLTAHPKEAKKLSEEELAKKVLEDADGLCDICRLFGSPFLASKLKVSDSRPTQKPYCQVRDGVGIDRDTETAREKIKFNYEVIEPGSAFAFRVEVENAGPKDFALLGILLTEMKECGIDVGGRKARGLGRCKLGEKVRVFYFDKGRQYGFAEFVKRGKLNDDMSNETFWSLVGKEAQKYLEGNSHAAKTAE